MIYIVIGLGGIIGSLLRYFVSLSTAAFMHSGFPFGTLLANLTGSLFLGWFTRAIIEQKKMDKVLSAAIGTGITGSFTTFSAFSLESLTLVENGSYGLAMFYILISSGGGLLLAAFGYSLGFRKDDQGEEAS